MPQSSERHVVAGRADRVGSRASGWRSAMVRLSLLLPIFALAGPGVLRAQRLAAPVKDSATVVYDDDGLRIHSADGKRQVKIKGDFATVGRVFLTDTNDATPNGFALRRGRMTFEAVVNKWLAFKTSFDIVNGGSSPIADAYADFSLSEHWWVRAGRQKVPSGLEKGTPSTEQFLAERSIANQLNAGRDGGLTITGEFGKGRLEATAGLFNGLPDGSNGDADVNDAKDGSFLLMWRPLRRPGGQGVTLGVFGVTGLQQGTTANSQLPDFSAPSSQTFFSYLESGGVIAAGRRTRQGLMSAAHLGRWGTNLEWYHNRQAVRRAANHADVTSGGFLGGVDCVLTGERSVQGAVTPARPFDPEHGDWGSVQVAARVSRVSIGEAAFPLYADPSSSAREATEAAVGLNWFVTKASKIQLSAMQTVFAGGAAFGADRKTERVLLGRLQVTF